MAPRNRILAFGSAAAVAVAGEVCGLTIPGAVGEIMRLTLILLGLGAILLLVFYEIGLSEDRERAREDEERRRRAGPEHEEPERRRPWASRPRRPS